MCDGRLQKERDGWRKEHNGKGCEREYCIYSIGEMSEWEVQGRVGYSRRGSGVCNLVYSIERM